MKKAVVFGGLSLFASYSTLASTVCGLVLGVPMFSLQGREETLTLVSLKGDPEILDRIERVVGSFACVKGTGTDQVYQGFDVQEVISDAE